MAKRIDIGNVCHQSALAGLVEPGCSGDHVHEQLSGAGRPTATVSPYALGLVKHWVHLFNVFLKAPMKSRCVFCAHAAGQPKSDMKAIAPREPARLTVGAVCGLFLGSILILRRLGRTFRRMSSWRLAWMRPFFELWSRQNALGRGYG